jgi:hypothetical protein
VLILNIFHRRFLQRTPIGIISFLNR